MTIDSPAQRNARAMLVAVFALVAACAGVWTLPPLDRDEARFAQATAQMLESGDYVTIRFQDRERNKKPAGIHWMQAASVTAFSDVSAREIWAYRIPSLIGIVLAALFTFFAASKLYDSRTGVLAGLLLASAPVVAAEGTIAKTDGVLLALICLAQLAFIHIYARAQTQEKTGWRWPLTFWFAQGVGVLVKGPIAPLVAAATGLGLLTGQQRFSWIARMRPILGVLLMIAMIAPWAIAIWLSTDGRFFTDAIGGDMLGKVGEAQEGHVGPPLYHFALLWLLFWPAAALILPGILQAWRERGDWRARFLLSWLIPAWVIFEIAATKLSHYVVPLYPALAIICAHAAVQPIGHAWPRKLGAIIFAGVGIIAAGLIAALPLHFSDARSAWPDYAAAVFVALAAIFIASFFWRGRGFEGGVAASVLAALYAWIVMSVVLPSLSQLAVSPRISTALEIAERHPLHDDKAPVAIVGYSEPSAVFLLGTQTALTDPRDAANSLRAGSVSAAIIEARFDDAFVTALKNHPVTALAVIDGLNYSNGKEVSLTIYVRAP